MRKARKVKVLTDGMSDREIKLWDDTIAFVETVCPHLDIRDVHATAEKVYRKMHFVTKLPKSE